MKTFETEIAEIFEVDNVKLDDELASFQCWDSLTILSIIALVDEMYGVTLSTDEINNSKTIGGLIVLIRIKM